MLYTAKMQVTKNYHTINNTIRDWKTQVYSLFAGNNINYLLLFIKTITKQRKVGIVLKTKQYSKWYSPQKVLLAKSVMHKLCAKFKPTVKMKSVHGKNKAWGNNYALKYLQVQHDLRIKQSCILLEYKHWTCLAAEHSTMINQQFINIKKNVPMHCMHTWLNHCNNYKQTTLSISKSRQSNSF